jgi:hypothetical protein
MARSTKQNEVATMAAKQVANRLFLARDSLSPTERSLSIRLAAANIGDLIFASATLSRPPTVT